MSDKLLFHMVKLSSGRGQSLRKRDHRFMIARTAIAASACVLVAILAGGPASAATCTNGSLFGTFGYYHERPGGIPASGATSGPDVVLGQLTLDGQGNVTSGSWTWGIDSGSVAVGTTTGTYSISKNCTGTLTLNNEDQMFAGSNPAGPSHFNIYLNTATLTANNNMFQMIQSDQNWNQPGAGVAQGIVTCGLTGRKAVWTTNLLGLAAGAPADTVGQLTLDGVGGITGIETFTNNSVVTTLSVTGTYTENANCTGTWTITPKGGAPSHFNTVKVGAGLELLIIETDNNTFNAGSAYR